MFQTNICNTNFGSLELNILILGVLHEKEGFELGLFKDIFKIYFSKIADLQAHSVALGAAL